MGLDFFGARSRYVERHTPARRRVLYDQTNGTLIDDEWAAFFKQHDFLVGIEASTGREAMHDACSRGQGRPADLCQGDGRAALPASARRRIQHADHAAPCQRLPIAVAVYRFLDDECQSRFLQFIPIIERVPATALELVGPDDHGAERARPAPRRGRPGATARCTSRRATW